MILFQAFDPDSQIGNDMILLRDDGLIPSFHSTLSQTNGASIEGLECWHIICRGQPHGTGQAFVGVIARSEHNEPATSANRQRLSAYPLAHHLSIRVIGARVAFDNLPLVIDGLAFAMNSFEFRPYLC